MHENGDTTVTRKLFGFNQIPKPHCCSYHKPTVA
jgi:hypothetical protein